MMRLISIVFLVITVGCDEDAFESCDPDKDNLPVGGAVNSDYLHRCEFTANVTWTNAFGLSKNNLAGQTYWNICDACPEPAVATCRQACEQLATNHGVAAADLDAACADINSIHETESPYGSPCEFKRLCDADDYPLPEATDPVEPPDPGDPTFFCIADLSITPDKDDCPTPTGGAWGRDENGVCASLGPTSSCGFAVYDVPLGDDPDQQCKELCPGFLLPVTDAMENNCDTFVRAEICPSELAPGVGSNFTWETPSGSTCSPLACTGSCCGEFGTIACANISANTVIAPVAQRTASLSLPVEFEVGGVVSRGTVVGTASYSVTSCPTGQTCPLYLESMVLHAPSALTGTWVDAKGRRHTVRVSNLNVRAARPAIGGYRPATGDLQLRAHSLDFEVRATVDARSMGLPTTTVSVMAGNTEAILGRLSTSTFTIATSFELNGSRLVIGTP